MSVENALYVVATPIGNLQDMVPRALAILQSVQLVAAEDTRHSGILLNHFGISTKTVSYHDYSSDHVIDRLLTLLAGGDAVALISDAGTPLISDPGYRLVSRVHDEGYRVIPVPGASAVIAALSAGGLPTDRFIFEGFLPAKSVARKKVLQSLLEEQRTTVFYEAPHRILESLYDMVEVYGGDRVAVVARELTKTYETIRRGALGELCAWVSKDPNQRRGEFVVMVEGMAKTDKELTEEVEHTLLVLGEELPAKQAASLAARITGLRKNILYSRLIELKKNGI